MSDAKKFFVVTHAANVNLHQKFCHVTHRFDSLSDSYFSEVKDYAFNQLPWEFEVNFTYDSLDTKTCFPVYVYSYRGEPVAWWNCEENRGFCR